MYADNFFSTESSGLVPDGRRSGSLARELDVGALTSATIDHSRVHAWYHGTADLAATSDGDGLAISDEREVVVEKGEGAELLVFDLA